MLQGKTVRFNVVSLIHVLSEVLLGGSGRESVWLQNSCIVHRTHLHRLKEMTQQVSYIYFRLY